MELLRSIFAQIGINKTFYVQFIIVVVVYSFLSKLMFRPLLTILLLRKHKTVGMRRMSEDILMDVERKHEEYESKWKLYEDKAEALKEEIYDKKNKQAKDLIREANKKANKILQDRRIQIEAQLLDIDHKLNKEVSALSDNVSDKLMGGGRA